MKVRDCMCNQVECVKPETTVCDVAKLMLNKHIGCVPVCNANKNLVGLVTDRDLILRTLACEKDIKQTPVSEVMTTNVYKTTPEANVEDVSKIMCDCQVRRVPVVENEQVIGIITLGDLANNQHVSPEEVSITVEGICRCGNNAQNAE
ncbi:MAG: CBS domain-containing protein [Clostridia bacterium]